MHLAPTSATLRTRKPRPLRKVDPQIKPPLASIELLIHHRPRILQAKRSLKQVKIWHAGSYHRGQKLNRLPQNPPLPTQNTEEPIDCPLENGGGFWGSAHHLNIRAGLRGLSGE
jgi:hypothetical protein